jgi:hypothetical protein
VLAYPRHVDQPESLGKGLSKGMALVVLSCTTSSSAGADLTDVKHLLSRNPLKPPQKVSAHADPRASALDQFPGGLYEIGHAGPGSRSTIKTPRRRTSGSGISS